MAIVSCENCGAKVSDRAPRCSGCGLTQRERKKKIAANAATGVRTKAGEVKAGKQKVDPGAMLSAIVVAFVGLIVVVWWNSSNTSARPNDEQIAARAVAACQEIVRERLTSPASAKFPWGDFKYAVNGPVVVVSSHVDSANAFGAMLRSDWSCQARHNGGPLLSVGSWDVEAVQIKQR